MFHFSFYLVFVWISLWALTGVGMQDLSTLPGLFWNEGVNLDTLTCEAEKHLSRFSSQNQNSQSNLWNWGNTPGFWCRCSCRRTGRCPPRKFCWPLEQARTEHRPLPDVYIYSLTLHGRPEEDEELQWRKTGDPYFLRRHHRNSWKPVSLNEIMSRIE